MRTPIFFTMLLIMFGWASADPRLRPNARRDYVRAGDVSFSYEDEDDDRLDDNPCMAITFPCNGDTDLCCFFTQDTDRDGSITGPNDYNLAWCCSFEDKCGVYPYTCGADNTVPPSLNVTKAKPPQDVGPGCGGADVTR